MTDALAATVGQTTSREEPNFRSISSIEHVSEAMLPGPPRCATPVPRRIHFIWVGGRPPQPVLSRALDWARLNPACDVTLWDDAALAELAASEATSELSELLAAAPNPAAISDVGRFAVLHKYGGVYLDSDMEARRPIDPLFEKASGFVARESRWLLVASVVGLPVDSLFARLALRIMFVARESLGVLNNFVTGPPLVTEMIRCMRILAVDRPVTLPPWTFFPDNPFRFPRKTRSTNPPFGVHLFDNSWGDPKALTFQRRVGRAVLQPLLPRDVAVGDRRHVQLELRRITMIEAARMVSGSL